MGAIIARVMASVLITLLLGWSIRTLVVAQVQRSTKQPPPSATMSGVTFVVSSPAWRSKLLAGCGLLFIAAGSALVGLAVVVEGSATGGGIPGVIIALTGGVFLRVARSVAQRHLEVTTDSIWVFGTRRAPREIAVAEITKLKPLVSNRYGGVTARAGRRKLFSVNRLMLGYAQLIDYLATRRPDLNVPEQSVPLQV